MKKRTISLLLVLLMASAMSMPVLTVTSASNALAGSLDNFTEFRTYQSGMFRDVTPTSWFSDTVAFTYNVGLFDGMGDGLFAPDATLTIAQSVKLAACLHSIYYNGSADFVQGSPWYRVYVDYLVENDVMTDSYPDYNAAIVRAEFARMFASAFPDEALVEINNIKDGDIPDISLFSPETPLIYMLYRAGILTGSDDNLTFNPNSTIKRSEASAIAGRMANTKLRQILKPKQNMTAKFDPDFFFGMHLGNYIDMYTATDRDFFSGAILYTFSELPDYMFFFVTNSADITDDLPFNEYELVSLFLPISDVFPEYEGKTLDELTIVPADAYSIVPESDNSDVMYPSRHGVYITQSYIYNLVTRNIGGRDVITMVGIEKI